MKLFPDWGIPNEEELCKSANRLYTSEELATSIPYEDEEIPTERLLLNELYKAELQTLILSTLPELRNQ